MTLTVLIPRGEIEDISYVPPSPRLSSLAGKKIGILNSGKPGGEMLLPYIEEALKKRVPSIKLRTWKVPYGQPQQEKMPALRELASYSDGVIALIGD